MATHVIFFFLFSSFLFLAFAQADKSSTQLLLNSLQLSNTNVVQSNKKTTQSQSSWIETILQTQNSDTTRVRSLSNSVGGTTVPIGPYQKDANTPAYTVEVMIGNPMIRMNMAIDTSHSVTFVPCVDCADCVDTAGKVNPSNTIKCVNRTLCSKVSTKSSCRGKNAPCSFSIKYSMSTITANLVQDTIALGKYNFPGYTFGCMESVYGTTYPAQGMLGLGPQSLSLLSQTDATFNSKFSYCLSAQSSSSSRRRHNATLKLGDEYQLYKNKMQTTPLIVNPSFSSYFVKLIGIKVDGKYLSISRGRGRDQEIGNGTVIDTGTVYSVLVQSAYNALKAAIRKKMKKQHSAIRSHLGGFDTCYNVPVNVTSVTLMFPGMNLDLYKESFLIKSKYKHITCLAMSASSGGALINVIGTYQQQKHRVLFDIPNSKLGVAPENCI